MPRRREGRVSIYNSPQSLLNDGIYGKKKEVLKMTPRFPVWWYWYRELEGIFKKFMKIPIMLKLFIDFPVFGTKFILQFHFQ